VLVNLAKWKELSDNTGVAHIGLITNAAIEAFNLTKTILHALAISQKLENVKIAEVIGKPLGDLVKKSNDLVSNKEPKFKNHAKCVYDGLGLLSWFLQGDPIEYAKEHTS